MFLFRIAVKPQDVLPMVLTCSQYNIIDLNCNGDVMAYTDVQLFHSYISAANTNECDADRGFSRANSNPAPWSQ